jgi:hypothetical protein
MLAQPREIKSSVVIEVEQATAPAAEYSHDRANLTFWDMASSNEGAIYNLLEGVAVVDLFQCRD